MPGPSCARRLRSDSVVPDPGRGGNGGRGGGGGLTGPFFFPGPAGGGGCGRTRWFPIRGAAGTAVVGGGGIARNCFPSEPQDGGRNVSPSESRCLIGAYQCRVGR